MAIPTSIFAIGDIVTLRSGGPGMTVCSFEDDTKNVTTDPSKAAFVRASWLDTTARMQHAVLPVLALNEVSPDEPVEPAPRKAA